MTTTLLFKDVLQLLEFVEITKRSTCLIDTEKLTITCELSEADIELAVRGYAATLLDA
jgi:hypothetical protein